MADSPQLGPAGGFFVGEFKPPIEAGQYVRWTTTEHVYEGQVLDVQGQSVVIQWLGRDLPQVFPLSEQYFPPRGTGLQVIDKPRSADRVERDRKAGKMSIKRAASLLGVEPKRIRAMLRSGSIRGERVDGKWAVVNGEDVMARLP